MILAQAVIKMPEFLSYLRKIYKIPECYMTFARKMPGFYTIIARKNIFPKWGARAPSPVSYTYADVILFFTICYEGSARGVKRSVE